MSDMQDLIHTTTRKAYDKGVENERDRTLKLIYKWLFVPAEEGGGAERLIKELKAGVNA